MMHFMQMLTAGGRMCRTIKGELGLMTDEGKCFNNCFGSV